MDQFLDALGLWLLQTAFVAAGVVVWWRTWEAMKDARVKRSKGLTVMVVLSAPLLVALGGALIWVGIIAK